MRMSIPRRMDTVMTMTLEHFPLAPLTEEREMTPSLPAPPRRTTRHWPYEGFFADQGGIRRQRNTGDSIS
jgi:hypothetical protein